MFYAFAEFFAAEGEIIGWGSIEMNSTMRFMQWGSCCLLQFKQSVQNDECTHYWREGIDGIRWEFKNNNGQWIEALFINEMHFEFYKFCDWNCSCGAHLSNALTYISFIFKGTETPIPSRLMPIQYAVHGHATTLSNQENIWIWIHVGLEIIRLRTWFICRLLENS